MQLAVCAVIDQVIHRDITEPLELLQYFAWNPARATLVPGQLRVGIAHSTAPWNDLLDDQGFHRIVGVWLVGRDADKRIIVRVDQAQLARGHGHCRHRGRCTHHRHGDTARLPEVATGGGVPDE